MSTLNVKLLEGAKAPTKTRTSDAGWDLWVHEDVWVPAGGFAQIPTGVAIEIPDDCWAFLTGRSSTAGRGLLAIPGIIDNEYRGLLFAVVFNPTKSGIWVKQNQRIAQLIMMWPNHHIDEIRVVDELLPTERGTKGFGSSGT